jgi:P-type Ca2+ transporter type 2B
MNELRVLTRSCPNDKYLLVAGLKKLGKTVGVTGDGSGDPPALKLADVGIAMEIGST